jgi:EAL domain-containing protein (putative c-di-GMP-specific phosphodiesterase class I)
LEITETFIMHNAANALDVVGQLRALGITTAIDDFGTGYSSLAYLKHLPIDRLKIDRGFVKDLPGDRDDAAIVAAVIALGTSLGFSVIAEGVETEEQRDFLIRAGCDQGQGYLFSRPLPVPEFEAWLQARL